MITEDFKRDIAKTHKYEESVSELEKMLKERKTMSRVDIRKHFGLSEDKFATFLATATFLIPIYEDEKHNIGVMENVY